MKLRTTLFIVFAALIFCPLGVYAQKTEQSVVNDAPAIPAPMDWAVNYGHTDAFKSKIDSLNKKLDILEEGYIKEQQRIAMQSVGSMGAMGSAPQANVSMKEAEKVMGDAMKMINDLGLTMEDIEKMEKMSDAEAEAFIAKRMEEKGMLPAGYDVGQYKDDPSESATDKNTNAMLEANEKTTAYMEQYSIVKQKLISLKSSATHKIADLSRKYKKQIDEAAAKASYDGEDPNEAKARHDEYRNLVNKYKAEAYTIWSSYIKEAQGALKGLMKYAVAADEAKARQGNVTGDAVYDALMKQSYNALNVARDYLDVTASEPELEYTY
ncbi:MAG: hypothetical protein IJD28_02190 [Deferribacterales bacterium]|nr:hypothetical protein [Deferribacterales bacterium]